MKTLSNILDALLTCSQGERQKAEDSSLNPLHKTRSYARFNSESRHGVNKLCANFKIVTHSDDSRDAYLLFDNMLDDSLLQAKKY